MSSSDKTKKKLMETMRMTKANPGNKVGAVDTLKTKTSQESKTISNKKKSTVPKKAVKDNQKSSVDPYQTARRVWPD